MTFIAAALDRTEKTAVVSPQQTCRYLSSNKTNHHCNQTKKETINNDELRGVSLPL